VAEKYTVAVGLMDRN